MSLLPKDEHFFQYFCRQAACTVEAADALIAISSETAPDWDEWWRRIHEIEKRGDQTTQECLTHLYNTFVTPFDSEDIHDLSACLDDTLDALDEIARVMHVIRPTGPPIAFSEFVQLLRSEASACASAVEALTSKGDVKLQLVRINDLEEEADRLYDSAMKSLFGSDADAVSLLKSKEILEALEAAADSFERAAHVIERIALKNN